MANKVWWILYIVLHARSKCRAAYNPHLIICYNFNFINQLKKSVSDFAITDAVCLYADFDCKESL